MAPSSNHTPPALKHLKPGLKISHFELTRFLGNGAMGAVFCAQDLILDRQVAIKFIFLGDRARSSTFNEVMRQRFVREAQLMARLNHPGIVSIHEASLEADEPFLVMEFLEGRPLDLVLYEEPRLGFLEVVDVGLQAARALGYAWKRHQLIHRDLKPGNIMLLDDNYLKVLDLGLAKALEDENSSSLTMTGMIMGTPWFMSPEQHVGAKHLNQSCDIYALGTILYLGLTTQMPVNGGSDYDLYMAKLDGPKNDLRAFRSKLPSPLIELVYNMLAPKAAERVDDYDTIIDTLRDASDQLRAERIRRAKRTQIPTPSGTLLMSDEAAASLVNTESAPIPQRNETLMVPSLASGQPAKPKVAKATLPSPGAAKKDSADTRSAPRAIAPRAKQPSKLVVTAPPPRTPAKTAPVEREYLEPNEVAIGIVPGEQIQGYTIDKLIGIGGIGAVFRAYDGDGCEVALKCLVRAAHEIGNSGPARERGTELKQLRAAIRELRHEAIVPVREIGEDRGMEYLVQELFLGPEGRPVNLIDYCKDFGTQDGLADEAEFIPILRHLLRALEHAHQRGLVHGRLKPENILLQFISMREDHWQAELKVTDFGTSRLVGEQQVLQQASQSMTSFTMGGTPLGADAALVATYDYMSPEQRRGEPATPASDVYAIGLMAFRLLTGGRRPEGETKASDLNPAIRHEWDSLIIKALRPDPAIRYPDAHAMLEAMRAFPGE